MLNSSPENGDGYKAKFGAAELLAGGRSTFVRSPAFHLPLITPAENFLSVVLTNEMEVGVGVAENLTGVPLLDQLIHGQDFLDAEIHLGLMAEAGD